MKKKIFQAKKSNKISFWQLIKKHVGTISKTSAMQFPSYNFMSAFSCLELREKLNLTLKTTCKKACYGREGFYNMHKNLHDSNLTRYKKPQFVNTFAVMINRYFGLTKMRINDTGDLPDIIALEKLCQISEKCPNTFFWVSTRRKDLIKKLYEKHNKQKLNKLWPKLVIRFSFEHDTRILDDLKFCKKYGVTASKTGYYDEIPKNILCKKLDQNNNCELCVDCYDPGVILRMYAYHKKGKILKIGELEK